MNNESSGFLGFFPIILLGLGIWFLIWNGKRAKAKTQAKIQRAADEFLSYADAANATGTLPQEAGGGINLQKNEFIVLRESSTLYEYKAERRTTGGGTRVKVGNMPIYLGGSTSSSVDVLKEICAGTLMLTNKRLMFVGTQKSFTAALADIITIENALTQITVTSQKRQKPVIFTVRNGFFWYGLPQVLNQWQLTSPIMPGKLIVNG